MAEALSIAASAVQFADLACRVARELYTFVSALKDASDELRRLNRRIKELAGILLDVQKLAETYKNSALLLGNEDAFNTLNEDLKSCTDDLRLLQKIVPGSTKTLDKSFICQLQKRFKTVFKEKEITKISQRLDSHKASLSNALSVIGRRNDLQIYGEIRSTTAEVHGFRANLVSQSNVIKGQVSIEAQQAKHRHTILRQDIAKSSSDINTHHSNLTQRLGEFTQEQSNTEARIFQANTQTVRRLDDISQSQHRFCTDLTQSISDTKEQLASISSCQDGMKTGIEKILRLNNLQISVAGEKSAPSISFLGSPVQAIQSLSHMCPHVYEVLSRISVGSQSGQSLDLARWIDSELQNLFQCAITTATQNQSYDLANGSLGRQPPHKRDSSTRINTALTPRDQLHRSWRLKKLAFHRAQAAERILLAETITELLLPTGKLIIAITEHYVDDAVLSRDNCLTMGGRVLFVPGVNFRVSGLAASFIQTFDQYSVILPSISVFGILPNDSPIFSCLKDRNISGVQDLLARGQVSPKDRDQNGNSLLDWVLWYFDYDICSLLLREGSDAFNCDIYGNSVLTAFIYCLPEMRKCGNMSEEQIIDATRLLIRYCGPDMTAAVEVREIGSLKYLKNTESLVLGALHRYTRIYRNPLLLMLQSGYDIEEQDYYGNTPLLVALSDVPQQDVISVAQFFLNARANPLAANSRRFGSLLSLLRRLSSCNDYTMDSIQVKAFVDLLIRFLGAGCDPSDNSSGWMPSDTALSPTCWVIWCNALEGAGYSIESVLREDDIRDGVAQSDCDINENFLKASECIAGSLSQASINHNLDLSCEMCYRNTHWKPRKAPFDDLGSYLIKFGNRFAAAHGIRTNHYGGSWCEDAQVGRECSHREHRESEDAANIWSVEELSWRKHIAYRLWREGKLSTPLEAEIWATNFGDDEDAILDPERNADSFDGDFSGSDVSG